MDKVTTVVWDCDGTLLDTEALFAKGWQSIMKDYDLEISDKTIKGFAGMDDRIVHAELAEKVNLPDFQTTMNMIHNAIRGKLSDKDLIFNDVVPCLDFLLKKNIKQGCASASPEEMVLEKLTKSDLVRYFNTIYGGDMVENNKPAPDIYLSTFKELDVNPENVLIVEDSPYGIESGKRSGARVLAVNRGMFNLDQLSQADYNLDNLDLDFFESII